MLQNILGCLKKKGNQLKRLYHEEDYFEWTSKKPLRLFIMSTKDALPPYVQIEEKYRSFIIEDQIIPDRLNYIAEKLCEMSSIILEDVRHNGTDKGQAVIYRKIAGHLYRAVEDIRKVREGSGIDGVAELPA
jgi:hypothetical protein